MQEYGNAHFNVRLIVHILLYTHIRKKTKGGHEMKTLAVSQPVMKRTAIPYPNAATRREILHKTLDYLLCVAIGVAATVALLFFLTFA